MILSIISLILAIAAYSISQLQQHHRLKWMTNNEGFWGWYSYTRKYKNGDHNDGPAFPGSTTFLVFLTDGYHLCQMLAMLFLSLSFGFLMGDWRYFAGAYFTVHFVHYFTYKLLSK